MEAIFALLSLIGIGYAAFRGFKWMFRAGGENRKQTETLTPNDLKVLEESAARLIADLNATADDCVKRIEAACAEARTIVEAVQSAKVDGIVAPMTVNEIKNLSVDDMEPVEQPAIRVICSDDPPAEAARHAGMTTGEIELIRGLKSIVTEQ